MVGCTKPPARLWTQLTQGWALTSCIEVLAFHGFVLNTRTNGRGWYTCLYNKSFKEPNVKHLKLWCHLHTKMNHHTYFSVQDFKKCPALSSSADTREDASGEGPLQLHAQKPPLQQVLAGQQVNSPGVLSVLKREDLSGALAALPFPSHVLLAQKLPHAAFQTLGPAVEHQPMPCSQISLLHSSSRAANFFLKKNNKISAVLCFAYPQSPVRSATLSEQYAFMILTAFCIFLAEMSDCHQFWQEKAPRSSCSRPIRVVQLVSGGCSQNVSLRSLELSPVAGWRIKYWISLERQEWTWYRATAVMKGSETCRTGAVFHLSYHRSLNS